MAAFLILYMVLGKPFVYRVLIVTHVETPAVMAVSWLLLTEAAKEGEIAAKAQRLADERLWATRRGQPSVCRHVVRKWELCSSFAADVNF